MANPKGKRTLLSSPKRTRLGCSKTRSAAYPYHEFLSGSSILSVLPKQSRQLTLRGVWEGGISERWSTTRSQGPLDVTICTKRRENRRRAISLPLSGMRCVSANLRWNYHGSRDVPCRYVVECILTRNKVTTCVQVAVRIKSSALDTPWSKDAKVSQGPKKGKKRRVHRALSCSSHI